MKNFTKNDKKISSLLIEDESRLVHRMVQDFSTWETFGYTIRKQLNLIGIFLRTWLSAERGVHFFTNPRISHVHWMSIGKDERDVAKNFEEELLYINIDESIREVKNDEELWNFCVKNLGNNRSYLLVPFSRHDTPFGHFIFCYCQNLPNDFILSKIKSTLNVFRERLKDLLYNHYPITNFTYLPSFQSPITTEAAILFCDIRSSTDIIEITRMAKDDRYTKMVITLIKSFLEYASQIISVRNIGRIHNFMGDGFLATFGEHLTVDQIEKAKTASALGILTAVLLVEGFENLWSCAKQHPLNQQYLGMYNEDIDLRLGTGVNYGQVCFDLFGIATALPERSRETRGFYQFTAVGDHMNFAQRLCSVANQPISSVGISYRSEMLRPLGRLTAPVIASRTVTYWCRECIHENFNPLIDFRTDFEYKGKGHPMPCFEFYLDKINKFNLLELLKGLHDNHFYEALESEAKKKDPKERAILRNVVSDFNKKLNRIHAEYKEK